MSTSVNSLYTNDVYRSISQSLDHNPENYNVNPWGLLITACVTVANTNPFYCYVPWVKLQRIDN